VTAPTRTTAYVAEDEPLAREALVAMLTREPGVEVLGAASNGEAALRACLETAPDVLVTDIRMPRLSGLELAAALRDALPRVQIVFVTAHDAHAIAAFRLAAVDYLLKPVTDADFRATMTRVRENATRLRAAEHVAELGVPVDALLQRERGAIANLVVRSLGRVDLVPLSEVVALCADGNYVDVITSTRSWLHRETIKSLADRLDPARFVQVHRSTIVALSHVRGIGRDASGCHVTMADGRTFAVGARFLRGLEATLGV
jgi:two-component system, LytTR family, response regulator